MSTTCTHRVIHDQTLGGLVPQQPGRQAHQHLLDHLGLERAVRDRARPRLALRHVGRQARVLAKVRRRDVPAALQLRHALGGRHVVVAVEREHHSVARVQEPGQRLQELPPDVLVPRLDLRALLPALHQADLAVREHRARPEGGALRERLARLGLEAVQPGAVDRHLAGAGATRAARASRFGAKFFY